ncbi:mevalonate kinase [Carpediemonas membranifera]|uniref:mevalonate kinase n=1 Tax=Carpediemonas membranifera TaxID=201153 RepID=A0A8J6E4L4_9EUKA|nr:mevalonate kinase [Carpediemonas membranifera]|eukprot:KAG9397328.1 mevalonate kinase [Carpediemonas membranifera]
MTTGDLVFQTYVPGKVILSGEHAVVNGYAAVVVPINAFLTLSIKRNQNAAVFTVISATTGTKEIFSPSELSMLFIAPPQPRPTPCAAMVHALALCAKARGLSSDTVISSIMGLTVSVDSELPMGAGMGSSAALCTAMARTAVHIVSQLPREPEQRMSDSPLPLSSPPSLAPIQLDASVYDVALALEHLFHGKSSGIDVFCCLNPNLVTVSRTGVHSTLAMPEGAPGIEIVVVHSGVERSTADAVAMVQGNADYKRVLGQIGAISAETARLLGEGMTGDALETALASEQHLEALGLSVPSIGHILSIGQQLSPPWVGKISGAGLGGAVIFPVVAGTRDTRPLLDAVRAAGFEAALYSTGC